MDILPTKKLEQLGVILKAVLEIIGHLKESGISAKELTYKEVIKYFVEERPSDPRVDKGAFVVERHAKGIMTIWTFLDSNNQPVTSDKGKPYYRKLKVTHFDKELEEMLDGQSLLIVT